MVSLLQGTSFSKTFDVSDSAIRGGYRRSPRFPIHDRTTIGGSEKELGDHGSVEEQETVRGGTYPELCEDTQIFTLSDVPKRPLCTTCFAFAVYC